MKTVTIHESGNGSDRMRVDSIGNGLDYSVYFGESGSPMLNLYFQGDDASQLRDEFDAMESTNPEMPTRDAWFAALDPYL